MVVDLTELNMDSEATVKNQEVKEYDNKARLSSYVLAVFSWIVLLAGFALAIKYFNAAAAINKLSFSNRERMSDLQSLYYVYAWAYMLSGVVTFALFNVINAIYVKLYPQDPNHTGY